MHHSIENSIRKANKLHRSGSSVKALNLLEEIKAQYPNNPRLETRYKSIQAEVVRSVAGSEPPANVIEHLQELHAEKKFQLIIHKCERLLEVQPQSSFVWNMLGAAQLELKMADEAVKSFEKALAIQPNYVGALVNYGKALNFIGKPSFAVASLQKAIDIRPDNADAHQALGSIYEAINEDEAAEHHSQQALKLKSDYADAKNTLGVLRLKQQKFAEGWALAEVRFNEDFYDFQPKLELGKPEWQGEHVNTLFAWSEQGVGDEAMFASCLTDLLEHCDNLVVSVSERLIPLFSRSFTSPRIKFVPRDTVDFDFDVHIPLMTALGKMRPDLASFQQKGAAYLVPDTIRQADIASELRGLAGDRPIFGISWFSLAKNSSGKKRSVLLPRLVKSLPRDAFLISLQYGSAASDIEQVKKELGRDVVSSEMVDTFADLDGLCALICACDHIVTIDNATAHFAGALGQSCDVLLPFNANWRWGLNGTRTTVWYDSVRLNWQGSEGNWQSCLKRLKNRLRLDS